MHPSQNGHAGLTREQILAAVDLKVEAVEVPEWGGTVYLRNLSGKARDQFESTRFRMVNGKAEIIHANTRASLLALSICDAQGNLQMQKSDVEALGEKNGAVLDRLFDVAQHLSGMHPKDLEERTKNLSPAQNDNSGTSLP